MESKLSSVAGLVWDREPLTTADRWINSQGQEITGLHGNQTSANEVQLAFTWHVSYFIIFGRI